MLLWYSNIYIGSETLGTILYGFLWHLMPPWRNGMDGPYMWSALTESSGFSGKLQIIHYRK